MPRHFSSDSIIQRVVALYPVLLLNRDNPSNSCDNTRSVNILAHTHACTSLFLVIRSIKVSYMVLPLPLPLGWLTSCYVLPLKVVVGIWGVPMITPTSSVSRDSQAEPASLVDALFSE